MADFHDIVPRSRRSTNGTYFIYPLEEMHGKMRGKRPSDHSEAVFVNRFRDYGHNTDEQGRKGHQSYYYRRHQGVWSNGATANRALMFVARRSAHAQIADEELSIKWQEEYKSYCLAKQGQNHYSSLFTYVYSVLYQQYKVQLDVDFAAQQHTELVQQFAQAFRQKRFSELLTITDRHYTGPQCERMAKEQATEYITLRFQQANQQ